MQAPPLQIAFICDSGKIPANWKRIAAELGWRLQPSTPMALRDRPPHDLRLTALLARIETCAARAGEGLDELRNLIRQRSHPAVPINLNQAVDSSLQYLRHRIERLGVTVERRYATAPNGRAC